VDAVQPLVLRLLRLTVLCCTAQCCAAIGVRPAVSRLAWPPISKTLLAEQMHIGVQCNGRAPGEQLCWSVQRHALLLLQDKCKKIVEGMKEQVLAVLQQYVQELGSL
jgi:hypothetical protein